MTTKRANVSMSKDDPDVVAAVQEPEAQVVDDPVELQEVETASDSEDYDDDDDDDVRPFMVEDMDPNTSLWTNGPTAGDVVGWKNQFGDVYFTSINLDEHIIWRCIDRHEWRMVERAFEDALEAGQSQTEALMDKQEIVTEMCVIFPQMNRQAIKKKKAGIPALIYQQVLEASGFMSIDVRQL